MIEDMYKKMSREKMIRICPKESLEGSYECYL